METVGNQYIRSYLEDPKKLERVSNEKVRRSDGTPVLSYLELAMTVAGLQFANRDFVLLFRGQTSDHRDKGLTSLKPSLLRSRSVDGLDTDMSFRRLNLAERLLVESFETKSFDGSDRIKIQRTLRWSILQHYEICATPLLDVTQSLRIAASFASDGTHSEGYIYVLAVPNVSGAITASAEAGLQILRLSSFCPPNAMRPHLQEGYLLGEYPEIDCVEQKHLYASDETDFGQRLIAKFRFHPDTFWRDSREFPRIEHGALYPDRGRDPFMAVAENIKTRLSAEA